MNPLFKSTRQLDFDKKIRENVRDCREAQRDIETWKSLEIRKGSYTPFITSTLYNPALTAEDSVHLALDTIDLYEKNYSDDENAYLMKVFTLAYCIGALKSHQHQEEVSKSLRYMCCSRCGTEHVRKAFVKCPCGQTLEDNKNDEEN